jgi:uncharacterized protein (TIGR02391 family)
MNDELFKCPNCDAHFPTDQDLWMGFKFNVCPQCGNLLPETVNYIENYFRIIQLVKPLAEAKVLLLKSKSVAAVREALITLETIVREKSGLKDLMGPDLMAQAFSFKYESRADTITQDPKIKINSLSNLTERNEQEGIKFFAMGLMQGIRNIYMHTKGTEKLYYCLQIITAVDLLLKQILGWESVAASSKL